MKTLHSALLLSFGLILPLEAFATNQTMASRKWTPPTCDSIAKGPSSVEQCRAEVDTKDRLKQKWPTLHQMMSKSTEELCKSSSSASKLNQNRCQEAVDELKRLLAERREGMLNRCDDRVEQVKACQACQSNLSAAGCQQEDININQKFSQRGHQFMQKRRELMNAAKNVENEMFQLSEDYGQNISDLERDMVTNKQTSPAAQEIGASSISEGLNKHGGASPADIFRKVEEFRNKTEVTDSDIQSAQSVQSQYARESLTRALEAKAARLEMEKENQQDSTNLKSLDKNTAAVSKNTTNLSSVDPAASSAIGGTPTTDSGLASSGLAGAGAGMAMGGMGAGSAGSGSPTGSGLQMAATDGGGTFDPNAGRTVGTNNHILNGVANNTAGAKDVGIQDIASAEQVAADGTKANGTSASRMSVKDALRAKLAAQMAQGKGGAVGASQAGAGKAGSMDAKLKEKAGANPEMMLGFSAAELSAGGGGDNFSMAQSETDAAVKEMMSEFEGSLDGEGGMGGRHLASVADGYAAPEILAADSSDLFLRTKTFYERCQKRGCVTR